MSSSFLSHHKLMLSSGYKQHAVLKKFGTRYKHVRRKGHFLFINCCYECEDMCHVHCFSQIVLIFYLAAGSPVVITGFNFNEAEAWIGYRGKQGKPGEWGRVPQNKLVSCCRSLSTIESIVISHSYCLS